VRRVIEDTGLFQLLKVMREVRAGFVNPVLAQHGLHPGQELLLAQLWREDGLAYGELVARLGVRAPTVTKALQRLERAGLVERRPASGRGHRIHITPAGRDVRVPVEQAWREADGEIARRLTARQRDQLGRIISRLTNMPS
jgi:DNA-binding MarR family transcriptional regulator